ncbi:bifunctional lysine-specific demethylase and histidyl-hydroxylase NO66 [Phlebotomus papatasi]|uniref:bifunctional lysine-specific demethylase and histidyl-hydroxylase NO66 n=1 Tax=Phlebotomus papatasi TaxID=29031 RepID=UPI00248440D7|nr:bifunctional lysine-specific demethylase and histidyl-hydroxylase NO66 [Phlebotomus papatasi]
MNGYKNKKSLKRKASESTEKPSDGSVNHARELLQWMISPVQLPDFLETYWEKKALLVSRNNPLYFKKLVSLKGIDEVLRNESVLFTENIDITLYEDGERKTLNETGRAMASNVWESYREGCSVRFLNPQIFFREIHLLDATVQEYFECMVGSNMYLTPPNSQGFAPHYDDIEAFILQVEGKKRWRLYEPRNPDEYLARVSSRNFSQDEVGEPFMDVVLEPGDLLYFPRGTIHQAHTVDNHHSLHITISTYQKYSWADYLEKVIPAALTMAVENDPDFRRGLPMGLASYVGISHSDNKCQKREEFFEKTKKFFEKLFQYAPIDDAVDQLQKQCQHDFLPPVLSESERRKTVSSRLNQFNDNGEFIPHGKLFSVDTRFRLLRKNIYRIVAEEDSLRLYYHVNNSKVYHEYESVYIEIDTEVAPVAEKLIHVYPQFLSAADMNISEVTKKQCLRTLTSLWDHGLLQTENPLDL